MTKAELKHKKRYEENLKIKEWTAKDSEKRLNRIKKDMEEARKLGYEVDGLSYCMSDDYEG